LKKKDIGATNEFQLVTDNESVCSTIAWFPVVTLFVRNLRK